MEVRPVKAEPTYANIYLRFRDRRFGTVVVPGFEVEYDDKTRTYESPDAALRYIRKLHDDNLKESAK